MGKHEAKPQELKPRHKPKPVFSPAVPPRARALLTEHPKLMTRADAEAPRPGSDLQNAPGATLGGLLAFAGFEFGSWLLARWILYAVLPDGLAVWLSGGLAVIGGVLLLAGFVATMSDSDERGAAHEHHGNYRIPADWDEEATELMLRAQRSVRSVQKSEVNKQGLLDAVKNNVVLPEQLWDLGRVLHQQSVLRARQAEAGEGLDEAQRDQIFGRQRQALALSTAAMEEKVAKLEKYADQVRNADAVLRAEAAAQLAAADSDQYLELLATTEVAGSSSLLEELSKESVDVHKVLASSLAAALEAGQTLALPAAPPTAGPAG